MVIRQIMGLVLGSLVAFSAGAQDLVQSDAQSLSIKGVDMLARYEKLQGSHGGFRVPIQTSSVLYNTQMLFLYAYLGLEQAKAQQIAELFKYIWSQQNADGSFSAYPDDGGSADATLMVYVTAKMHHQKTPELDRLESALQVQSKIQSAGTLALPYLMLAGADARVNCVLPMGLPTLIKQDKKLSWLRVLMYPMLYLYQTKGVMKVEGLKLTKSRGCLKNAFRKNASFKKEGKALVTWYQKHVDDLGMVFSYVPTTIPWVMALHHLKHKSPDLFVEIHGERQIALALKSMEEFQVKKAQGLYQSPGEGSVAESVEVAKLFLDAGVSVEHPLIQKVVGYLQSIQQANGGLGFSQNNRGFPDPDDTSLTLSVWQKVYAQTQSQELEASIRKARAFILSRPNRDGGFGDWDRDHDIAWWFKPVARQLEKTGLAISESAVDVTSRVLLGLSTQLNHPEVEAKWLDGIEWLLKHQRSDGSYLSTWMVGYGFGTGSALSALATALHHPKVDQLRLKSTLDRGVSFLLSLQKEDGAFSEDLRTYLQATALVAEKSSPAMTGIVFSRIMMFLELAPEYREVMQASAQRAYAYLAGSLNAKAQINDSAWTAVSFPKIEYARYEFIQEVEVLRSLVLFEKIY